MQAFGVPVDPGMLAWFDANVTADGAHPGRWRRDFDDDTCARIDEAYYAAVERLRAAVSTSPLNLPSSSRELR